MKKRDNSWMIRKTIVGVPFLWLIAFLFVPFLIVFKISLSQTVIAQPPYAPVFSVADGLAGIWDFLNSLSLENYRTIFTDTLYVSSYIKSLEIAAISTLLLLLIGFPVAYAMARAPRRLQPILAMAVILPFWTAFLIRIYAWINILQREGILNDALMTLRVIDAPVAWLASDTAIFIGIVYSYLPFMVLPIYSTLEKMDPSLLEAAADLGCPRWKAFWVITVPLAAQGVFAGALLCFIPVVGEFVIPDLLGGSQSVMIGQTLWIEFFANRDWPVASALAIVLLLILLIPVMIGQQMQARALERR